MRKVFFSYSHKDEELRNELEIHLAPLKRQGIIASWHDRRIIAGSDFNEAISAELESAQIILLLVSAYFLNSDYCYEKEMARALEKHEEGSATVIPVILHPCDWRSSPFGGLRATPTDGKAVSMFANQHEAFAIIAKDVREAADSTAKTITQEDKAPIYNIQSYSTTVSPQVIRSSNLRIKRKFDDHEKDQFLENSYEYIARHFDGSLQELAARNPQIKARFKRLSETSFSASVYENGTRVAQCSVRYGGGSFNSSAISYSNSPDAPTNSFNEQLSIIDDGYQLQLKSLGMQIYGGGSNQPLSQQGAAELFWDIFIKHLQ